MDDAIGRLHVGGRDRAQEILEEDRLGPRALKEHLPAVERHRHEQRRHRLRSHTVALQNPRAIAVLGVDVLVIPRDIVAVLGPDRGAVDAHQHLSLDVEQLVADHIGGLHRALAEDEGPRDRALLVVLRSRLVELEPAEALDPLRATLVVLHVEFRHRSWVDGEPRIAPEKCVLRPRDHLPADPANQRHGEVGRIENRVRPQRVRPPRDIVQERRVEPAALAHERLAGDDEALRREREIGRCRESGPPGGIERLVTAELVAEGLHPLEGVLQHLLFLIGCELQCGRERDLGLVVRNGGRADDLLGFCEKFSDLIGHKLGC